MRCNPSAGFGGLAVGAAVGIQAFLRSIPGVYWFFFFFFYELGFFKFCFGAQPPSLVQTGEISHARGFIERFVFVCSVHIRTPSRAFHVTRSGQLYAFDE